MSNLLFPIGAIVGIVIAVVVIIIIIAIVSWWISTSNMFIRLKNQNEAAFAQMDVYLKKRYDLIPNLVETVKGYAKHESDTLEKVIKARNQAVNASTTAEKIEANANISKVIKTFNAVAEQYPELKANTNFMDLSNQLKIIEAEIVNARTYYNATVKAYNLKTELFPSRIVARAMNLERYKYFEVDDPVERQNVKVQF